MSNYPVLSPLRHDGKSYAVGEVVPMAEKTAANLILLGILGQALPDEPLTPPEDLTTKSGGKKSGAAKGNSGNAGNASVEAPPAATATDGSASDTATATTETPPEVPPAPVPEATK